MEVLNLFYRDVDCSSLSGHKVVAKQFNERVGALLAERGWLKPPETSREPNSWPSDVEAARD